MKYTAIRSTDKVDFFRRIVDMVFDGWTPIGKKDEYTSNDGTVFIRIMRKPA